MLQLLLLALATRRGNIHVLIVRIHVARYLDCLRVVRVDASRLLLVHFIAIRGGTCAAWPTDIHISCRLVPQPVLVLVIVPTSLAPIVVFFVHVGDHLGDRIVASGHLNRARALTRHWKLVAAEHRLVSTQLDRLILIKCLSNIANVIGLGWFEVRLWCSAQIKSIHVLIDVRPSRSSLQLLLMNLILPHQALLEDARGDAQLELVLFDLIIEVFNDSHLVTLLLLDVDTNVARSQLMLLD